MFSEFIALRGYQPGVCACLLLFFSTCFIDRLSRSEFTILFEISSRFRSREKEKFFIDRAVIELYLLNYQSGGRSSISIKIFYHDARSIRQTQLHRVAKIARHSSLEFIAVKQHGRNATKNSNAKRHRHEHRRNKFPSNCVD